MNLYLLFSSIFIIHSIRFCVFFHWLAFNCFIRLELTLPKITFLILPIWFLAGLINLTVGLFWKYSSWSFKMKKKKNFLHWYRVRVRLLCSSKSLFLFCLFYLWFFFFVFLYFEVIAFHNNLLCCSLVSRYMLEALSARVIVFFELWVKLMSSLPKNF